MQVSLFLNLKHLETNNHGFSMVLSVISVSMILSIVVTLFGALAAAAAFYVSIDAEQILRVKQKKAMRQIEDTRSDSSLARQRADDGKKAILDSSNDTNTNQDVLVTKKQEDVKSLETNLANMKKQFEDLKAKVNPDVRGQEATKVPSVQSKNSKQSRTPTKDRRK